MLVKAIGVRLELAGSYMFKRDDLADAAVISDGWLASHYREVGPYSNQGRKRIGSHLVWVWLN